MSDAGRGARRARVGRTGARFPAFVEFDEIGGDASLDEVHAPAVPSADIGADDAMVGRTGARFNSRARRAHRTARRTAADDAVARAVARADHADATTLPIALPAAPSPDPDDADDRVWVRPYVRTRGRTRSRTVLAVETLVSLRRPHPTITDLEHLAIAEVCVEPRSVAEVAARVGVPLGVARVLIDDMATIGVLVVHDLAVGHAGAPPVQVLQRVLDGLHRL